MAGPWEKFQEKPKEALKPWEKFQAPKESDDSLLESAGKYGAGVATGVAEVVNPLAIPRSLEVLARAPFQEAAPDQSFLGRVVERLSKAQERAVIPEFNVAQIASGVRAPITAVSEGKSLPEAFATEMERQKEFETEFLPKGSKGVGEAAASIYFLGAGAKQLAGAITPKKVRDAVKKMAGLKAYESLKPLGKKADIISEQKRAEAIGDQLLKDKIVTKGASFKKVLERVENKVQEYGEKIGYFAKQADDAVARDSSIRGIPIDDLASEIELKVISPALSDPSTRNIAKDEASWTDDLKAVSGGQDLTFAQAQKMKSNLNKMKAKFERAGDDLSKEAFRDVYRILNSKIEEGIDQAFTKAAPNLINDFTDTKVAYRNLIDAEDLIEKTVSRMSKNRGASLTDYLAGTSGGLAGAVLTGSTAGAGSAAITLGIANRLARTRGNQLAAGALDTLSNFISKEPNAVKQYQMLKASGALNALSNMGREP